MKKISALLFLFLLTGCSATMIQSPNSGYGPSEGRQVGRIVYDPMIKKTQEDAYKQMYKACDGKYRIVDEQLRQESEETTYDTSRVTSDKVRAKKRTTTREYMYVTFECIKEDNK